MNAARLVLNALLALYRSLPLLPSLFLSLATQGRSRPFGQHGKEREGGVFCLLFDCAEAVASSFYRPVRST